MTCHCWEQSSSTNTWHRATVQKNINFFPPLRSINWWIKEKIRPIDVLLKCGFYGQISVGNYRIRESTQMSQPPIWSFKLPVIMCKGFKAESGNQSISSPFLSCATLGYVLNLSVLLLLKWGYLLPHRINYVSIYKALTTMLDPE